MAVTDSTRPCPGVEILQDLHAALAGAAELLKAERILASKPTFAENLVAQAMDRAATLREVLHG